MLGVKNVWRTRLCRGCQRGFGGTHKRPETPVEQGGVEAAGRSPHYKEVW